MRHLCGAGRATLWTRAAADLQYEREAAARILFRGRSVRAGRVSTRGGWLGGGMGIHRSTETERNQRQGKEQELQSEFGGVYCLPNIVVLPSFYSVVEESVDKLEGGGKVALRGCSNVNKAPAYSLRNGRRAAIVAAAKENTVERCESPPKQKAARNKSGWNTNKPKGKITLDKLGSASNTKVKITPSLRTYFRILPGVSEVPAYQETAQRVGQEMSQGGNQDSAPEGAIVRENLLNQPVHLVQPGQENCSL
ncbi:hypothetical protein NDU88_004624 [Pleurodeles waltl]|uniref:Uncharacterized protein n=1 Tax=Pleurodeles waltl TaxID=8319 RepID=A0AAV7VHL3_PLEWA|nr:hypothetical protein NDU88_004624 [Pleurodeles waltl]